MLDVNAYHIAYRLAPTFMARSCIIEQGGESAVPGHNELTACAADKIFFYIKPFVYFFENFRLMCLNPLVFPNGVFYGRAYSTCIFKIFEKF